MGTEYTNDNYLGDMIIGGATGASYNSASSFGARTRVIPSAPKSYMPQKPTRDNAGTVGVVAGPVRQVTPEDLAEFARRDANRRAIARKAPFFKRLSGHVMSYLNADGDLIVNAEGDLHEGQVVARSEHLRRLEVAYQRFWETHLEVSEAQKNHDESAARLYRDASERMKLLKSGKFLAPVEMGALKLEPDLFRRKKTLFGSKIVRNRMRRVRIIDYDRRFRKFVDFAYGYGVYLSADLGGRPLKFLSAQEIFEYYLKRPYTITH